MRLKSFAALAAWMIIALSAPARAAEGGAVEGTLVDERGEPVVEGILILTLERGDKRYEESDVEGKFRFERVPAGKHTLQHAASEPMTIELQAGETREVKITIERASLGGHLSIPGVDLVVATGIDSNPWYTSSFASGDAGADPDAMGVDPHSVTDVAFAFSTGKADKSKRALHLYFAPDLRLGLLYGFGPGPGLTGESPLAFRGAAVVPVSAHLRVGSALSFGLGTRYTARWAPGLLYPTGTKVPIPIGVPAYGDSVMQRESQTFADLNLFFGDLRANVGYTFIFDQYDEGGAPGSPAGFVGFVDVAALGRAGNLDAGPASLDYTAHRGEARVDFSLFNVRGAVTAIDNAGRDLVPFEVAAGVRLRDSLPLSVELGYAQVDPDLAGGIDGFIGSVILGGLYEREPRAGLRRQLRFVPTAQQLSVTELFFEEVPLPFQVRVEGALLSAAWRGALPAGELSVTRPDAADLGARLAVRWRLPILLMDLDLRAFGEGYASQATRAQSPAGAAFGYSRFGLNLAASF